MPPLKIYSVRHPKQEIIDRVAEAFRVGQPASLMLVGQDGQERDVKFTVLSTDRNTVNILVIGTTLEKETINISISTDEDPTALLRT